MRTPHSAKQRKKSEHPRICGRAERQRCKHVRSPSKAADGMPRITLDCRKRRVQHTTAERVIDNIEALARSTCTHIFFHRLVSIDTYGSQVLDKRAFVLSYSCIHFLPPRKRLLSNH